MYRPALHLRLKLQFVYSYSIGSSMKAERRHELKHNELADWMGERVETLRPHAAGIALGVGVLLVIVLGSLWYFSGENAATSRAWSQYFDAFNGRELQKVLQTLAV